MTEQPEALRLADWCEAHSSGIYRPSAEAAAELRRLHAQREVLLRKLREYVEDYQSEEGMYDTKHYVKKFMAAIKAVEQ